MTDKNSNNTLDVFKKIVEQERIALEFGFYWANYDQLLEQIQSEANEIKEAVLLKDRTHLQEEIGDLISAAISLCVFFNFDPYTTISESVEKMQKRFDLMVSIVKQDGLENLQGKSLEVLLAYWERAKKAAYDEL